MWKLLRLEVMVSYLGQDIGYTDLEFFWFSSVLPGKWILSQLRHRRFLPNLSNVSFVNRANKMLGSS
jgi:hypothetical protein